MGSKQRVRKPSRVELGPLPGRWPKQHGGYSLLRSLGRGTLDGRSREWIMLKTMMHELARDQGKAWGELSAARRLLIEAAATKAAVLSMMANWAIEHGAIGKDGQLAPTLRENFLAFANSLRHDLLAVGLSAVPKETVDLDAYVKAKYGDQNGVKEPSE